MALNFSLGRNLSKKAEDLVFQQKLFVFDASRETNQTAVFPDNAMTRHEYGDGIIRTCRSDGAR